MLQLTSTITENATIEIGLRDIEVPKPGADEVLIEVQASPINPSDLGTLVGAGDLTSIRVEGEGDQAKVIMDIPESVMWAMKPRIGKPLPVGNEGSGTVIDAGENAKHLIGKLCLQLVGACMLKTECCQRWHALKCQMALSQKIAHQVLLIHLQHWEWLKP